MLKLLVSDLWTLPWTVMVIEILGPSPMLKLLVTDLWTLFCNIMFIHPMWESCSLLIFIIMFSVACEISPFTSTHTEPMRAAVLDSTHSMHQLEALGASLLLKLLVTDLWTLLWTILFIYPMWENSSLILAYLLLIICILLFFSKFFRIYKIL